MTIVEHKIKLSVLIALFYSNLSSKTDSILKVSFFARFQHFTTFLFYNSLLIKHAMFNK